MHALHFVSAVSVCAWILSAPSASAQFHDDCSAPIVLTNTGTFGFDNTFASTGVQGQSNPGCGHVGKDLWYRWTALSTGVATLQTCGLTSLDTSVSVYLASSCPGQPAIACDDDACGLESYTTWTATLGFSYMLQIGVSGGGPGGPGSFILDLAGPPANDNCLAAIPLSGSSGDFYDNTVATTGTQGQGNPGCTSAEMDLWWEWTATQNGTATLDTCGQSARNTVIAVYVGGGCPTGVAFACDDDGCGLQSQVTFAIVAGVVYMLQIGNPQGLAGGPGSFIITETGGGSPGISYCSGDGTATLCPCGNNAQSGHGCGNSVNVNGALLASAGGPSVMNDTFLLEGSEMPAGSPTLYFQGTQRTNGGQGLAFGDGLRCVSGTVIRLGIKANSGGMSSYGGPAGDIPVSIRGQIPASGGTRDYQAWYRNAAAFCTPSTFNLTNGVEVVWAP